MTTASFRADVLAASPQQAGAGRLLGALVRALQAARAGAGEGGRGTPAARSTLVKMNIDEHPQIAGQLGIQSIPAVIAFDSGQPVDGFVGALPESQIRGFIERLVGPLKGGDGGTARRGGGGRRQGRRGRRGGALCRRSSPRTRATSRRSAVSPSCTSPRGDVARGQGAAGDRPAPAPGKEPDPAIAAAQAAVNLGRTGLERRRARAARGGGRGQSRRPSGAIRSGAWRCRPRASGTRAADALLEIIRRDRKWNDEAARKQLCSFSKRGV